MTKIIWLVIILGLVGGAGYFWLNNNGAENSLINDPAFTGLTKLTSIKLDTSFFSDPEFLSLREVPRISQAAIQKGRLNPFIPLARR